MPTTPATVGDAARQTAVRRAKPGPRGAPARTGSLARSSSKQALAALARP